MTTINAQIVKEFSDAWGRADLEALMPHLADDFVFCASVGPEPGATYVGKEAAREGFRRMFDEYHQVDDAVCRIEEQVDFATDQETDELKMKRAWLKDQMYRQIRRPAPAVAGSR